jgi:hypothetical protein
MSTITNVMWDLMPQLVHMFLTTWNTSMMTTSTMMLGLVSNGIYWIDALNKEVEYPLKGISNLQGEYERCTVLFHDCAANISVDKAYSINARRVTQ